MQRRSGYRTRQGGPDQLVQQKPGGQPLANKLRPSLPFAKPSTRRMYIADVAILSLRACDGPDKQMDRRRCTGGPARAGLAGGVKLKRTPIGPIQASSNPA